MQIDLQSVRQSANITGTLKRANAVQCTCGQLVIGFVVADSSLQRAARFDPGKQLGRGPPYTHILLGIAIPEREVNLRQVFSFRRSRMTNGAIPTDNTERIVKLEVNSKWQNLFTKFALGAVLAIALAYVGLTTVIVFQLGDLDEKLVGLTTNQIEILDRIKSLPE